MENVWLYTRLSRALGDPDDPALMAAHLAALKRLAAADGISVPAERIFTEVGSGESITSRPVFARLLAEWQRLPPGAGGTLYLVELARLGRGSNQERGLILDTLIRAGIQVHTPDRRFDPSQPNDEFLCSLIQAMDRNENNRYRQRVRLKWDEMTREGLVVTGGAPYGYHWDKNARTLLPAEPEFQVVGRLYQDALDLSARQLSARYGLRQPHICRILRNPVYTGWPHRHCKSVRYGPRQVKGTQLLPRDQWLLAERPGSYPAAVSVELWEAVQVALDTRLRTRAKCGFTDGWCRDVLCFRDDRGHIYLASHLESRTGQRVKQLVYALRPEGRPRLYIDRELVHQAALAALSAALRQPDLLQDAIIAEAARQEEAERCADQEASPAALQARLCRLRHEVDNLLAREIHAPNSEQRASIARVWEATCQEIEALKRSIETRERATLPEESLHWLTGQLPNLTEAFTQAWAQYTEPERRRTVNAFLETIEVLVLPVPGQRAYRREVVALRYRPWLESLMSKRSSI